GSPPHFHPYGSLLRPPYTDPYVRRTPIWPWSGSRTSEAGLQSGVGRTACRSDCVGRSGSRMLKCISTSAAKRMLTKGESFMKRLALALLALPLAQSGAWAQAAGSPAAGKAYWERVAPRNTDCRNCHGGTGEGAFGPDLAGRGLSAAQVL